VNPGEIAAGLAGAEVLALRQLDGGRNSRVFRVTTAAASYALKLYPSCAEDGRDRLGVECAVLRWMQTHGFAEVPRVINADPASAAVLLSWAEGDRVRDGIGEKDVTQACHFLARLHALRATPAVPRECLAAEACLSCAEVARQVRARIALLRDLEDPALSAFLDRCAEPALKTRFDLAQAALGAVGICVDGVLAPEARSQVPADFGFHNALRRADGQLSFLDFEYFGWDDPAKLAADILLHPGTPLDSATRQCLHGGLLDVYGGEPGFAVRLYALLPLFALRWALILLNEFRPAWWRRRVAAGTTRSWQEVRQDQLAAAHAMLERNHAMGTFG